MKWLEDIVVIAAELKCQRAVYEVDENVALGSKYDDVAMDDLTDSIVDDDPRTFVVTASVSRGLVRRRYSGSKDVMAYIFKTRVSVECVESPLLNPDGEYTARTPGVDHFEDRTMACTAVAVLYLIDKIGKKSGELGNRTQDLLKSRNANETLYP
ncbi:hypothetical protein FPQ18DRAFT_310526 [Pyronema domesticum]|nr:hypothetical protein FPQ18DRAFT_310526 [Pyronema domesticum]